MGERGWAGQLLEWRLAGSTLTAEVSRARYFVRAGPNEVLAHAEVRDHPGGQYRLELGSFGSVSAAQVACEEDAVRRCRPEVRAMTEIGPNMAGTACPICGEACKVLLPETAGNYAFACVVHHDFEVTKSAMPKGKHMMVARWEAALRKAKARAGIGRPCIEVGDFEGRLGR
jgi:hypothetical protein